jgi:hypothetical protein
MTMNQSARPSLYNGSASSDNAEVFSILGVLEPTRRSGKFGKRVALVMFVLLSCAGALAAFNKTPFLRSITAVRGSTHPPQTSVPPTAVATPAVAVLAVAEPPAAQASVARIVADEPAEKQQPAGADMVINTGAGKPSLVEALDVTANQPVDAEKPAAKLPAKDHVKAEKIRPKHEARSAAPVPVHEKKKDLKRKDDRDVDLIAALLTRTSEGNDVAKPTANVKEPKASSTRSKQNRPAVTAGSEKQNRNLVVVKQAGETMEAVVHRCRALGLIEGELCRLRVCSDKWGKDPACPSSGLAPVN